MKKRYSYWAVEALADRQIAEEKAEAEAEAKKQEEASTDGGSETDM